MVSNQIVDSDAFLDMPLSAQALYLHLLVRADDEGFTNGVKKVMRMIGSRDDDLKVLIGKKFVIMFESGVLVVKHWLIHNTIRQDRIIETVHIEEKRQLDVKPNKSYTLKTAQESHLIENDRHMTDTCQADDRIDKYRLVQNSIDKNSKDIMSSKHDDIPYSDIIDYLNEKANTRYRSSSQKTKTLIHARFNEGFNLDDFKTVIDKKCKEWKGSDMEKYLRPETLFGTKFESYKNQTIIKKTKKGELTEDVEIEWFDDYLKKRDNT